MSIEGDLRRVHAARHPLDGDLLERTGLAERGEREVGALDEGVVLGEQQSPRLALGAFDGGNWPNTSVPSISTAEMNNAVGRSATMASICWVSSACLAAALSL